MLFSSISFLYYFIPCVMVLYFAAPGRFKNTVLFLSSLFFYAWGEPVYVVLLSVSITQGYLSGRLIEKHIHTCRAKFFAAASVTVSLCILIFFKYTDFFIDNINGVTGLSVPLTQISMPIGISFYTFQLISYVVDVYREKTGAQKNYIDFAAYLSMFPQLIAGPVVRYSDIAGKLGNREHTMEGAANGIRRFVTGLSKKVLLANTLGSAVSVFRESDDKSVLFFWVYAVSCTLQIYFDFSGYSDMAIGLGAIFGFRFPENFNYPYISESITEFWRRWHISLGTWFRDYLYIPLGGNRVSFAKWVRNIFLVWAATGLWHGASWNFVLWGVLFAALLAAEKLWLLKALKKHTILKHIYVLVILLFSFVIFDSGGLSDAFFSIRAMLFLAGLPPVSAAGVYYLKSYAVIFVLSAVCATPFPVMLWRSIKRHRRGQFFAAAAEPVCLVMLFAVCTAFLVDGSFNPFLYFRF